MAVQSASASVLPRWSARSLSEAIETEDHDDLEDAPCKRLEYHVSSHDAEETHPLRRSSPTVGLFCRRCLL